MLKLLRKKKVAKRIFYILAIIIIPAFVIWGSASVLNKDKTPSYAGIIFGKKVSFDEFRDALFGWRIAMQLQFGDKAREVMNSFFKPSEAAWDRLILLHEVKARHIKIKDDEVVKMIANFPFLQKDGRFDPQSYNLFLRYSISVQPHVFEEKLRQNIAMARVFQDVTKNITITEDEIRKDYEKQNIQTKVKYVLFNTAGYKSSITVTEEELKTYYENNKNLFRVPPQINAIYAAVELKEDTSESEKEESLEKMKKFAAKCKSKGIEAAAKDEGLKLQETGFFGLEDPIPAIGWMPQVSGDLFNLNTGAFSSVMKLERGIYLFKVKERRDAHLEAFNDIKEKVKDKYLGQKSKEIAKSKADEFLKSVQTGSTSFEKAAEAAKLEVKETPLFTQEGYIPEIGMGKDFMEAFSLAKDQVLSHPIELGQGFYVIKSMETTKIDEDKYKKEKEEFSKTALDQKKNKAFNEFFQDLKKKAGLIDHTGGYDTLPR